MGSNKLLGTGTVKFPSRSFAAGGERLRSFRGSFLRRFNCTVASTASMRQFRAESGGFGLARTPQRAVALLSPPFRVGGCPIDPAAPQSQPQAAHALPTTPTTTVTDNRLALSRDRSTRGRGKSPPFGSRTRQRNGTLIHRRALHERGKLGCCWTEESGHWAVGRGLRNRGSSRDRTCN